MYSSISFNFASPYFLPPIIFHDCVNFVGIESRLRNLLTFLLVVDIVVLPRNDYDDYVMFIYNVHIK